MLIFTFNFSIYTVYFYLILFFVSISTLNMPDKIWGQRVALEISRKSSQSRTILTTQVFCPETDYNKRSPNNLKNIFLIIISLLIDINLHRRNHKVVNNHSSVALTEMLRPGCQVLTKPF
jgi:hypothetical protein